MLRYFVNIRTRKLNSCHVSGEVQWRTSDKRPGSSSSYHVQNPDVAIGKHYCIWRCRNRQHEGKGSTQSTWQHNVQRVDLDRYSLQQNKDNYHARSVPKKKRTSPKPLRHISSVNSLVLHHQSNSQAFYYGIYTHLKITLVSLPHST